MWLINRNLNWKLHFLEGKTLFWSTQFSPQNAGNRILGFWNNISKFSERACPKTTLEARDWLPLDLLIQLCTLFKPAVYFNYYWNPSLGVKCFMRLRYAWLPTTVLTQQINTVEPGWLELRDLELPNNSSPKSHFPWIKTYFSVIFTWLTKKRSSVHYWGSSVLILLFFVRFSWNKVAFFERKTW